MCVSMRVREYAFTRVFACVCVCVIVAMCVCVCVN